jgi:rSAM/selenodomain-associated transferase 1
MSFFTRKLCIVNSASLVVVLDRHSGEGPLEIHSVSDKSLLSHSVGIGRGSVVINQHDIRTLNSKATVGSARRGSCALAMFVKAPRAGESKTRLVPPLTPAEAAHLSNCFLRDTSNNIDAVASDGGAAGIAVYTPIGAESSFNGLLPGSFSLIPQRGDSFGDRLSNAALDLLALGFESLCLIDSDSPTLPPELLIKAVVALSRPGDRVVLGAAQDGGYYLIGLKQSHPQLFESIDWSTSKVLSQTMQRAEDISLETEILPSWFDVDDAETLQRLCSEMFGGSNKPSQGDNMIAYQAPNTRDYLARLIKSEGHERIWPNGRTIPSDT